MPCASRAPVATNFRQVMPVWQVYDAECSSSDLPQLPKYCVPRNKRLPEIGYTQKDAVNNILTASSRLQAVGKKATQFSKWDQFSAIVEIYVSGIRNLIKFLGLSSGRIRIL